MEIISRKEALDKGLKRYFTGGSCKHGHVTERRASSGSCCECTRLATKAWRVEGKSKGKASTYYHKPTPDNSTLESWFIYNKVTGDLIWKERSEGFHDNRSMKTWNTRRSGKVAGSKHYANHYIEVRIPDGSLHKAHRLVWKMCTGEDASGIVDHVNGAPWDNRF